MDTSVVIGSPIEPPEGEVAVSAATVAELHFGVLVARNPNVRAQRLRRLALVQRTSRPLPVDGAVAGSYGELAAAVVRRGRNPRARVMDLLIAATAHAHRAALYTRHPSDPQGLEHLVDIRPV